MNTKTITEIVLVVGIVAWIGWDCYANWNTITGDTISEITMNYSKQLALIPLILGVVCGHLFSSFDSGKAVVDWLQARPLLPFLWGVVTGGLFWNQFR